MKRVIRRTAGLALVWAAALTAQDPDLRAEIEAADARFFAAFNACDHETMGEMFDRDLEFFHDTGGLGDYESTMTSGRANCERQLGLRRELVEGSLEVYPIKDYGAIQKGRHTFCHEENGRDDCGTFGFVHVWKRTPDGWRITRVVSYGH